MAMEDTSIEAQAEAVRLLVVDDHAENITALEAILEGPGYHVVAARSGADALKLVLKNDFAVILLDVLMPLMDGFETARLIRGRDASRHTPIIFLTAAGSDLAMVERGYAVGAVDYLVKPLNADVVKAKVAVFVDLFRKARQIHLQEERLRAAERDRSDAAIRESEALYEASFNSAAVGIAHATPDGRWIRGNPRFWRTMGYAPDEAKSLRLEDVAHPSDLGDDRAALGRLASGEVDILRRETRYLRRDGQIVWVDLTVSPLRDPAGKLKYFIFLLEDITARRNAEKRERLLAGVSQLLLESFDHQADLNAVARLIVEAIGEWCVIGTVDARERPIGKPAVAHADADGEARAERLRTMLAASPRFARSLAHKATLTSADPAADLQACWDLEERFIDELGVRAALAFPLCSRNRILGRVTLLSRDGFGPGDVLAAHDVTQRIALALDNARLHQEAQEAVRVRDDFLSIASHELRTPLTPLRIHFQRLFDERGEMTVTRPDRLQVILQRCDRQVRRLETLIENLLDVSRITAGKLSLELADVDLGELVKDVAVRFTEELAAADCRLTLELAAPVMGRWDRLRVEQVVTNIVGNAIKYGCGQPIEIGLQMTDRSARLSIRDHGIGIAAGDLERIFQRFHRLVSSPSLGGLGLGLYIAKQIVDAHAGSITVESTPGAGTQFIVDLPANPPTGKAIEPEIEGTR
jgi:PAS domain S-box-containing protein